MDGLVIPAGQLITDMAEAIGDMRELADLAKLNRFDLFVYIRELSNLGLAVLVIDADQKTAMPAFDRVVRYKLADALRALLVTLRASNVH